MQYSLLWMHDIPIQHNLSLVLAEIIINIYCISQYWLFISLYVYAVHYNLMPLFTCMQAIYLSFFFLYKVV